MMVVELSKKELEQYIKDDTVRPHIPADFRVSPNLGRITYGLKDDDGTIHAVMCIAKGYGIPTTEAELARIGYEDAMGGPSVIPYTIWSYSQSSGRTLINSVIDIVRAEFIGRPAADRPRVVTMSPVTELAKRFHLRNGAVLLAENPESNNFEYQIY